RLFGAISWSRVALELGGELTTPSAMQRADGAGFSEQLLLGSMAGCGVRAPGSACLVAKAGQIRVAGQGVDSPLASSGLLIQAGLRAGAALPVGRRVRIGAHAEG